MHYSIALKRRLIVWSRSHDRAASYRRLADPTSARFLFKDTA